jgi:hypothetical protein
VKDRNWKKEYKTQLNRGDDKGQLERQKARREYDKKGVARKGKDIDHVRAISKTGATIKNRGSNEFRINRRARSSNRRIQDCLS